MSLMTLQVDLQETNRQLRRIGDLLERLAPAEVVVKDPGDAPKGEKVQWTSPAAQWDKVKQEMEQGGRGDEVLAGAYGPRSLRRD